MACCLSIVLLGSFASHAAAASPITAGNDALRTGWYPDQTSLNSNLVTGGTFGQLFSRAVTGQVYGQPLLAGGNLLVATEDNWIYGLDPASGAVRWSRNVGTPFNASDVGCSDLTPHIGITGTPVVDPNTNTAYFFSKTYVSSNAAWYLHAVDVTTGAERTGFPVRITGNADNNASLAFNAQTQMQRTGLLLMNGVVYAGFGSHCDVEPWHGWIIGVSTSGTIKARWATPGADSGSGIWQSGSGLVSDGSGQIIVSTGNGDAPTGPIPGNTPPAALGESIVRLTVQSDGTLRPTDFFAPYDAANLDSWDADLSSGGPVGLPSQYFGTPSVPNLLVTVGKQGYVYLLDRSNLGGIGEGPSGSDAVVQRIGPYGGVWSKPAVWPGDGGYVYIPTASGGTSASGSSGFLNVFHYGVSGSGKPTLSKVATSTDAFGFTSSAPVVTSNGTTSGSALVWIIWAPNGSGSGAQLRAYAPIPSGGAPQLLWSAPIGQSSKFTPPGIGGNRVYVGTRDGHVLGFGAPVNAVLSAPPVTFPSTTIGDSSERDAVFTASADVTVTGVSTTGGAFSAGTPTPGLPVTLHNGDTITVPVTFTPTTATMVAGSLKLDTNAGQVTTGLSGNGQAPDPQLSVTPPAVSFGGTDVGGSLDGTATLSNVGGDPLTINSIGSVSAPFSVTGAPAAGSKIAPGDSVTIDVHFNPTTTGTFTDELVIDTDGGNASVGLSGSAAPPGHLTLSPASLTGWYVKVGGSDTRTFQVNNTGGTPFSITKSKPPITGDFSANPDISEGTEVLAGGSVTGGVTFAPTVPGPQSSQWLLTGDDDTGPHSIPINASGVDIHSAASAPASSSTGKFNVSYSAADNGGPGLSSVELWVQVPGDTQFRHIRTNTAPGATGSFPYIAQAGNGTYRFRTAAGDAAGLYEGGSGGEADVVVHVPPLLRAGGPLPSVTKLLLKPSSFRAGRHGGARVTFKISAPGIVRFRVDRRGRNGHYSSSGRTWKRRMRRGTNSFHFAGTVYGRRLSPGLYRLVVTPLASDGFAGRSRSIRFRILR
jgi:HYDIN/CFA65/VesB family protein/putative pyrroloquinoline-quinone binding quinoprotein/putative pyrroloquinoline-quinone-binding quinoprotein